MPYAFDLDVYSAHTLMPLGSCGEAARIIDDAVPQLGQK